ncbi:hypothetical protein [Stackebrandtia soli]|uniref:hypothetical protein n=1 Tax=Stackebrandtia soli TaxID=1892856 RepID=UPI0039E88A4B
MTETFDDLIACEDVLLFVNAAVAATGQREFYDGAEEQSMSLDFLHDYMHVNYRELYTSCLALGVNDHNAALIIRRLLRTPTDCPSPSRPLEGRLIAGRLAEMAPQRAYRLFEGLARDRVNNRRTRAIIREWIAARPDPFLDVVKYRNGARVAARHAHLDFADERVPHARERGRFLFPGKQHKPYRSELLNSWLAAHYSKSAVYDLPFSIAEGFAARHGIPRAAFLERMRSRMTRLERLRLNDSAGKVGVDTRGLRNASLTRVASYVLGMPVEERIERRAELTDALNAAAHRATRGTPFSDVRRVVAVLDDSYSSFGSPDKRNRPLAVTLATHLLLAASAPEYTGLWLSGRTDALLSVPSGATSLGTRIVDALELRPDLLVIVSDGWDNAPAGLAQAVLHTWRRRLDPDRATTVVHLNPVYNASEYTVRRLATGVPTVGIRDAEDAPTLIELARFADGRVGLPELRAHLARRTADYLSTVSAPRATGRTPGDPT